LCDAVDCLTSSHANEHAVTGAGVAALTFGGCGGDDDNSATTTTAFNLASETSTVPELCEEVYADGVVFDSVDELSATYCDRGDGVAYLPGSATEPCDDGRILCWNDEGWGYLGEPFHRHEPGAEQVAPEAERTSCTGS
jgi:hypothetical protein